jgi:hypothetical protein
MLASDHRDRSQTKAMRIDPELPRKNAVFTFDKKDDPLLFACFWWEYLQVALSDPLRKRLSNSHVAPEASKAFVRLVNPSGKEPEFFDPYLLARIVKVLRKPLLKQVPWKELSDIQKKRLADAIRGSRAPLQMKSAYGHDLDVMLTSGDSFDPDAYFIQEGSRRKFTVFIDYSYRDKEIIQIFAKGLDFSRPDEWGAENLSQLRSFYDRDNKFYGAALDWLRFYRLNLAGYRFDEIAGALNRTKAQVSDLRKFAKCGKAIVDYMRDGALSHLSCLPYREKVTRIRRKQKAATVSHPGHRRGLPRA